ncbi:MAG: hypothetical protein HY235_25700 [Acidobacteria bacterium]|nr:hypothetical protein [Acidobacteriota bacterium]
MSASGCNSPGRLGGARRDLSSYRVLAFRVAAQFDPRNPNTPASQNFSVRLTDAAGNTSSAVVAGEVKPIPFPTGSVFRRSVLSSIRIPTADFRGADLSRITAIRFVFDRQREGAIFLSDVHLSPR